MKQITPETPERIFGKKIIRDCQRDLDKLAKAGIPSMSLIAAIVTAKTGATVMSEESKEAFRQLGEDAKQLSENIGALARKGRAFAVAPQYLNLLADAARKNSIVADAARKNSIEIGQWLRKQRKDDRNGCDQGIVMLLRGILRYRENFNCWAELERVIEKVYLADVGGGPRKVDGVSAGALSKVAGRIRRETLNGKGE